MSILLLHLSQLKPGKYYNFIQLHPNVHISYGISKKFVSNEQIALQIKLGKLLKIDVYGRPYDPEVTLKFEDENGKNYRFEPMMLSLEHYSEYEPDTEEHSKKRIQDRTLVLKDDILGNDWAMRPANVVATQGIDITRFQP